jgi:plastocyanin
MFVRTVFTITALCCAISAQAGQFNLQAKDRTGAPLPNVVVSLAPVGKPAPEPSAAVTASVAQKGFKFEPFVTVAQRGTKMRFPNLDSKEHHVKTLSGPTSFEFKIYTSKEPSAVLLDAAGKISVHCLLHNYMLAHIYVVDTPWFAKSAASGAVSIDEVPDGEYELTVDHPHLLAPSQISPALPKRVRIGSAAATSMDVKFDFVAKPDPR